MPYFFFNKNCSYQLLPLLEMAKADANLTARFVWRAIPLDTLRSVLAEPGLVTNATLRPSHLREFKQHKAPLSSDEIRLVKNVVDRPSATTSARLDAVPLERQANVLDAAYDYLRTRSGYHREQPERVQKIERDLLLRRSKVDSPPLVGGGRGRGNERNDTPLPALPHKGGGNMEVDRPESAHGTLKTSAAFGVTRQTAFEEFTVRPALHDLEATDTGFVPGSQLDMLKLRLRYDNQRGKAWLEEFTLIQIKSFSAWEPLLHFPSWRLKAGTEVAHDKEKDPEDSTTASVNGGSGASLRPWKNILIYGLIEGDAAAGSVFDRSYRVGVGPSAGVIVSPATW
jgi:hypothetical protein